MNRGEKAASTPSARPTAGIAVLAAIVAGVFGLLLMEATLRLFRYQLLPVVGIAYAPCIYTPDESSQYRYEKNGRGWLHRNFEIDKAVVTNTLGFHDIDRSAQATGREIAVVGDSFTAAIHVPVEATWTQVLEKTLQGDRFDSVVNLGLDGAGPKEHLAILREYLDEHDPDHVIYAFYRNDLEDLRIGVPYRECYKGYIARFKTAEQRSAIIDYIDEQDPGPVTKWLHENVYSFRILARLVVPGSVLLRRNMVSPSMIGMSVEREADLAASLEKAVLDLQRLADSRGVALTIIPMPAKHEPSSSMETLEAELAADTLASLQIIDIAPKLLEVSAQEGLEYDDMFWAHDGHLNALGNRIVGVVLANHLTVADGREDSN